MAINTRGRVGESLAREFLRSHNAKMFQADWIYKDARTGEWCLVEMKNKRPYRRVLPDGSIWEGMGLPLHQVNIRLEFQSQFGIRAQLVWCNVDFSDMAGCDKYVPIDFHYGWIDQLEESGDYIDIAKPSNNGVYTRIYDTSLFQTERIAIPIKKFRDILLGNV